MAGYSGTPLPKKLGLKDGSRVALLSAPATLLNDLKPLPTGVTIKTTTAGSPFDVILCFQKSAEKLASQFPKLARALEPSGGLWICWPKKSSGVPTDITENDIRKIGLAVGLVDNKVCAVDDTWSGLRFVYRLTDRPSTKAKKKPVSHK